MTSAFGELWGPDVRWLAGINESGGTTWVNKESFEELLCWLQIPSLLGIAGHLNGDEAYERPSTELAGIEGTLRAECQRMTDAGYSLRSYLGDEMETEPETVDGEVIAH